MCFTAMNYRLLLLICVFFLFGCDISSQESDNSESIKGEHIKSLECTNGNKMDFYAIKVNDSLFSYFSVISNQELLLSIDSNVITHSTGHEITRKENFFGFLVEMDDPKNLFLTFYHDSGKSISDLTWFRLSQETCQVEIEQAP